MSTMLPDEMSGGSRMDGNSICARGQPGECRDQLAQVEPAGGIGAVEARTRRLSSVRRTATPASTLPTVSETSMAWMCGWRVDGDVMFVGAQLPVPDYERGPKICRSIDKTSPTDSPATAALYCAHLEKLSSLNIHRTSNLVMVMVYCLPRTCTRASQPLSSFSVPS
jgi:hypothetical protein